MSGLISPIKRMAKALGLGRIVNDMRSRDVTDKSVFVGLASIPSRQDSLREVVLALLPQADRIGVYLNNWDEVPDFLKHPKILVARSQQHGDVRDNGKFFWVDKVKTRYYATVDDDILYPSDYIAQLIRYQSLLGGTYAVGVHATTYPKPVTKLLRNRHLLHFSNPSNVFVPVDLIGTGTLLFERAYWGLKYEEFGAPGMADVWFGVAARKRDFGLWVIPRRSDWIVPLEQEDPKENLFNEGRLDDSVQVTALNENQVGSTRRNLLERVVRVAKAGAMFSIADAVGIHNAANKISLDVLSDTDFRLFSGALVTHKREKNPNLPGALDEILEQYVNYQLHRASGRFFAEDLEFEASYKAVLKKVGYENLPHFAAQDWRFLGLRVPKSKRVAKKQA